MFYFISILLFTLSTPPTCPAFPRHLPPCFWFAFLPTPSHPSLISLLTPYLPPLLPTWLKNRNYLLYPLPLYLLSHHTFLSHPWQTSTCDLIYTHSLFLLFSFSLSTLSFALLFFLPFTPSLLPYTFSPTLSCFSLFHSNLLGLIISTSDPFSFWESSFCMYSFLLQTSPSPLQLFLCHLESCLLDTTLLAGDTALDLCPGTKLWSMENM